MSEPTPSEMNIVSHVKRTSTGRTTMQISLSIELRAMLAKAAKQHNMSQLSLIRCAISYYMQWSAQPRQSGQEPVPLASPEAIATGSGHVPVEPDLAPEPENRPHPVPKPAPEAKSESSQALAVAPVARKPRIKKETAK